jgi:hypothetical protein
MVQNDCGEIITCIPCVYVVLFVSKLFYEITFEYFVFNIATMCRRSIVAEVPQLVQSSGECSWRAVKTIV